MTLEVCANSFQSAKNAQKAGAHRIELCQELSVGGVTPSYGLLQQVLDTLSIETFVLVRPRSGHFVYSDDELNIIRNDIEMAKKLGCHGIVSGILNDDNTIDLTRTKALVELSRPLPFTFHRAFDSVPNPQEALEQLVHLGVERILTSGQKPSAEQGIELLKTLNKTANGRITILAGGGVNETNATLFKKAGFTEIHTSASLSTSSSASVKIPVKDNSFYDESITVSDIEKIKAILRMCNKAMCQ